MCYLKNGALRNDFIFVIDSRSRFKVLNNFDSCILSLFMNMNLLLVMCISLNNVELFLIEVWIPEIGRKSNMQKLSDFEDVTQCEISDE